MLLELTDNRNNADLAVETLPASPPSLGLPATPSTARGDRSGELIAGRYRILRRLGKGGMGSVWLAVDTVLARAVALKELNPSTVAASGEVEDAAPRDGHALREARAASATSHPGVVQVYGVLVDDDREWIVMEALSGTTLDQAIKQAGPLPVDRLVTIGLRLLEALQAIHRAQVVHGDLKPSNVQLVGTGRPVLTDFGLATGTAGATVEGAGFVAGSPPYMAPEVIRTGLRGPASDLFSLGATLYEGAEGRRPFDEGTPVGTALSILNDSPAPALPGSPLGQVIDDLLTKDPRQRLSAQDAYARLRQIETELVRATPVEAARPTPTSDC